MKKNRKQSKNRSAGSIAPKRQAETKLSELREPTDDDGKMDFGGLPDRDLKKNLGGCG